MKSTRSSGMVASLSLDVIEPRLAWLPRRHTLDGQRVVNSSPRATLGGRVRQEALVNGGADAYPARASGLCTVRGRGSGTSGHLDRGVRRPPVDSGAGGSRRAG